MAAQELQAARVVYLPITQPEEPPQLFASVPDVLDVGSVAELLGVNAKTVRREIERGKLACFHVGARVRITKQQLIAYVGGGAHE